MPKRASKRTENTLKLGERLKVTIAKFNDKLYFHFRIADKADKLSLNRDEMKLLFSNETKEKIKTIAKRVAKEPEQSKKKKLEENSDSSSESSGDEEDCTFHF